MYCGYCGRAVLDGANFCQFCGNKIVYNSDELRIKDLNNEDREEVLNEFQEDSDESKIESDLNAKIPNIIKDDKSKNGEEKGITFKIGRGIAILILFLLLIFIVSLLGIKNKKNDASEIKSESNFLFENEKNDFRNDYDYFGEYNENGIALASLYGYYGFIDSDGRQLTEFIYEDAENFINGLALVKKDGYYGYIDEAGKAVIGFYYDAATSFDPEYGLAIVETGSGKGVIDHNGELIVNTQYFDIYFDSGFIVVSKSKSIAGDLFDRGIYTTTGMHIIEDRYREFYFSDNKIYANDDYESFGHSKSSLGDVYDFNGVNLLREEPLLGATAITPPYNGICIVKYDDVFYYSWNGSHEYSYFLYYDENFNLIYNAKLCSATRFNKLGYAIVCHSLCNDLDNVDEDRVRYSGMDDDQYYILQNNETGIQEVQRLPELEYMESYKAVNDYYVVLHDGHGDGSDTLLDRKSLNKINCYNPNMVDGTNCIIVQNENSKLYGLYDGQQLIKDYLFNEISYDKYTNTFSLIRGAETEEYVPIGAFNSMESCEADT